MTMLMTPKLSILVVEKGVIRRTINSMNLQDISPLPATIGTIIFILTAGTLFTAISDYRGWRALGAGGLPYNPFGWAIQWYLSWRMGKDTVSLECYDKPLDASVSDKERARNDTSYLKSFLPIREGQRKRAAHWVIPQRQLGNPKPSTNISAVSSIPIPLNLPRNNPC